MWGCRVFASKYPRLERFQDEHEDHQKRGGRGLIEMLPVKVNPWL